MRFRFTVLLGLMLACSAPAFADGVEDAKRAFASGVERFRQHAFTDALAAFEASYRLNPAPGVLFNIALTQNELGRRREAYTTFERYLATATPSPAQRAETDTQMAAIRARLAIFDLDVPAGARVVLDGHPIAPPYTHMLLDPGDHKLEVSADGKEPNTRVITARAGVELAVTVALAARAPLAAAPPPAVLAPAEAPPVVATPAPVVAGPSFVHTRHGAATLALGALSLASFAVMAGTGGDALAIRHDYDAACKTGGCRSSTYEEGRRLAVASDVFLGVGLASAVAATIVAFAHPRPHVYAAQPRLALGPGGIGASF
jgi:hypothetical protein